MFRLPLKNSNGFSLIEIMVVLAIIGILTSILAVNYNQARQNARDKIRMNDLKAMQIALELYKSENGRYPVMGCSAPNGSGGHIWAGPGPHSASWGHRCDTDYIVGLTPNYIGNLPVDPSRELEDNTGYIYSTDTNGTAYKLMAHRSVELNLIQTAADEFSRCPSIGHANCPSVAANQNIYAVYSAGAENW